MNDDHAEDALLICRTLGGQPTATQARTTSLDADSIAFAAIVGRHRSPGQHPVRSPADPTGADPSGAGTHAPGGLHHLGTSSRPAG
ncbi:DUF2470 domain-containing protein [Micromonospora sp. CA-244673]|uniref:DUF2470 domain-containing protein n=1 Tax=Micromonospora sp. CA-244673 TaxID=3239958 RepID=UPI003D9319B8